MDSTEWLLFQQQARWSYERSRLQRALLGVLPVLGVVLLATLFASQPRWAMTTGGTALLLGVAMLWYGRAPQRAVLPGVAAGLVPLLLALCANALYSCGAQGCSALCVPACSAGGVVAGLVIAAVGRGQGRGFWLCASTLSLLIGAMGCACVGRSGLLGLGLGFACGMVPGLWRWLRAR